MEELIFYFAQFVLLCYIFIIIIFHTSRNKLVIPLPTMIQLAQMRYRGDKLE